MCVRKQCHTTVLGCLSNIPIVCYEIMCNNHYLCTVTNRLVHVHNTLSFVSCVVALCGKFVIVSAYQRWDARNIFDIFSIRRIDRVTDGLRRSAEELSAELSASCESFFDNPKHKYACFFKEQSKWPWFDLLGRS